MLDKDPKWSRLRLECEWRGSLRNEEGRTRKRETPTACQLDVLESPGDSRIAKCVHTTPATLFLL